MKSDKHQTISLHAIGTVKNNRTEITDDYWGDLISTIQLDNLIFQPSATEGLDTFSHLEIVFYMDKVNAEKIVTAARHPRNNPTLPKVGILAQRGKNRPNQIGTSFVKIIKVDELKIIVSGLDAINGTPILDIKPCMKDFLPRQKTKEPTWTKEIMKNYFD